MLRFLIHPGSSRNKPEAFAALAVRIAAGALMLYHHGWHKVVDAGRYFVEGVPWLLVAEVQEVGFPLPLPSALFATAAQALGSLFVIAGLLTRISGLFVASTLPVAIFANIRFGEDPQLPLLYLCLFLVVVWLGSGRYSVDRLLIPFGRKEITS